MPIIAPEEEKHGHTDTWYGAFKVKIEQFRRHRIERCVNATMDGYEFPRRHEAGDHTPDDHTNLARLLVKDRAALIRQVLHRRLLVKGVIGGRSNFSQAR